MPTHMLAYQGASNTKQDKGETQTELKATWQHSLCCGLGLHLVHHHIAGRVLHDVIGDAAQTKQPQHGPAAGRQREAGEGSGTVQPAAKPGLHWPLHLAVHTESQQLPSLALRCIPFESNPTAQWLHEQQGKVERG